MTVAGVWNMGALYRCCTTCRYNVLQAVHFHTAPVRHPPLSMNISCYSAHKIRQTVCYMPYAMFEALHYISSLVIPYGTVCNV